MAAMVSMNGRCFLLATKRFSFWPRVKPAQLATLAGTSAGAGASSTAPHDPPRRRIDWRDKASGASGFLHYTREGPLLSEARHVLVAWHGGPGSTYDWRYIAPRLATDVAVMPTLVPDTANCLP